MKILVVDDSEINLKVAEINLSKADYQVEKASSGKECIEKVGQNEYDAIFMDIMMPEMDGIETLKKLKEMKSFKTPVMVFTSDTTKTEEEYLVLGFYAYLNKPINMNQINKIMNSLK